MTQMYIEIFTTCSAREDQINNLSAAYLLFRLFLHFSRKDELNVAYVTTAVLNIT